MRSNEQAGSDDPAVQLMNQAVLDRAGSRESMDHAVAMLAPPATHILLDEIAITSW